MKDKYEGYNSLQADFTLSLELPEEPVNEQKGVLIPASEKITD